MIKGFSDVEELGKSDATGILGVTGGDKPRPNGLLGGLTLDTIPRRGHML